MLFLSEKERDTLSEILGKFIHSSLNNILLTVYCACMCA